MELKISSLPQTLQSLSLVGSVSFVLDWLDKKQFLNLHRFAVDIDIASTAELMLYTCRSILPLCPNLKNLFLFTPPLNKFAPFLTEAIGSLSQLEVGASSSLHFYYFLSSLLRLFSSSLHFLCIILLSPSCAHLLLLCRLTIAFQFLATCLSKSCGKFLNILPLEKLPQLRTIHTSDVVPSLSRISSLSLRTSVTGKKPCSETT